MLMLLVQSPSLPGSFSICLIRTGPLGQLRLQGTNEQVSDHVLAIVG